VALASGGHPLLHAHLLHDVHPVRVARPHLEIRVRPQAPRDLAAQLGKLLEEATGARWTIAVTNAPGEPTLAEQSQAAEQDRRAVAATHPMVQAILLAFPGATMDAVRDVSLDAYGLAPAASAPAAMAPVSLAGDDSLPDFAPPDAEPAYDDELPEED
jgi:DNA polymerase-3 subunit gamma/tau